MTPKSLMLKEEELILLKKELEEPKMPPTNIGQSIEDILYLLKDTESLLRNKKMKSSELNITDMLIIMKKELMLIKELLKTEKPFI